MGVTELEHHDEELRAGFQFMSWPTGLHSPAITDPTWGAAREGEWPQSHPITIPKACTTVKGVTYDHTQTGLPRKHAPCGVEGKRAEMDGLTEAMGACTKSPFNLF